MILPTNLLKVYGTVTCVHGCSDEKQTEYIYLIRLHENNAKIGGENIGLVEECVHRLHFSSNLRNEAQRENLCT